MAMIHTSSVRAEMPVQVLLGHALQELGCAFISSLVNQLCSRLQCSQPVVAMCHIGTEPDASIQLEPRCTLTASQCTAGRLLAGC